MPLGYEPARLQWVRLESISRTTFGPTIGYADTLLTQIGRLPGVQLAAMSQGGFGIVGQAFNTVAVRTDANTVDALSDRVSPEFFRTTSIPMHQGRDFTWGDVRNRANVAILNRSLADRLFPDGDAVGRPVRLGRGEQVVSVVGVAADATPGDPRIQNFPQYYLPLAASAPPAPALVLRLRMGHLTEASLREVVEPLGRHEVVRVSTMNSEVEQFLVQERLITSTSLMFAALAAVVSVAGLYATLSQNIIRRRREIAIRIAVGATPTVVRTLVLKDACWILFVGLGLGVPVALAGARVAHSLLSNASTNSVTLLGTTGLAIAIVVVFASVWPAQRAAHTSVAAALRSD